MIENDDTKRGRRFDMIIQGLILVSVISFCAETLPDLSERETHILKLIEIVTVIIFTIEYILRIFVADKPMKYIFSFFGLIDLLAILPFYLMMHIDLRSIRIFRMIRILRMIKIARYKKSMQLFKMGFISIKEELLIFITITTFLLFVSSVGIYYFEHDAQPEVFKSIFHSMWFSVITLSTVGYGDMYPITVGGKVFTAIMVLIGIAMIAVPTGLISAALTKVRENDRSKGYNKNSADDK